jgi:hypothetical protein
MSFYFYDLLKERFARGRVRARSLRAASRCVFDGVTHTAAGDRRNKGDRIADEIAFRSAPLHLLIEVQVRKRFLPAISIPIPHFHI